MKKIFFFALVAALTMVAAKPAPIMGKQETRYMSRAAAENDSYDIQVSTVMRTYSKDHRYMPLIVQVHNWEASNVRVSPTQFVLKDSTGKLVQPITADEYFQNNKVQGRRNIKYLSHRADTGIETSKSIWYIENSRFYPLGGKNTGGVYDNVNLRPNFYMIDWLYFPQMESGDYSLVYTGDDGTEMILPVAL